ncbi:hypothetical protein BS47DRAFT_480255 [Hydnum rufescens UP504]|uniref:PIN domain-containing protein n=1 Tax=Hydnum rufescens UP504 TaxID=1448309 RepID=A0A9P6AHS5_9AGAM|nr:hypothetical protein BS47DRAFT_480255 [Hydnum rufescens UP504]
MADVIVLDASVLVHALGQMKRWCKIERKEIIIVPLEALNTLDLLKKGGTTIAIHARAASRFLEAQVGTNPRIRVQRDEDFVPWDEIYSAAITSAEAPSLRTPDGVDSSNVTVVVPPEDHAPEWMRQVVCCAEWETRHAKVEAVVPGPSPGPTKPTKVALAVIKPSTGPGAVLDIHDPAILTHIPRTTGDLMRLWAPILGLKLLNVDPGTSDRSDHRPDKHRTSASDGNVPSYRKGGRPPSQDVRGLVEKVKNGVPGNSVVAPGGAGKIRLLTRGEKLDP